MRTLLKYGSAATCVANPSKFVQWERLQMRLITKTLDLPNTLNHDLPRRHADQPTIHDRLLYLAKRWYGKACENNTAQRDFTTTTPYTTQENDDEYQAKYRNSNQSSLFFWYPSRNAYQLRNKKSKKQNKK